MKKTSSITNQQPTAPSLSQWMDSTVGERAVAREQARLAVHLQRAPGQRLLLLGGWFPSYALGERWRRPETLPAAVDTAITLATPNTGLALGQRKKPGSSDASAPGVAEASSGVVVDGVSVPEQLPLRNERLDVIVAPHLAEHCDDLSTSVREAARALEGGGWFMITGFMPATPLAALVTRQPGSGWVRRRVGPSALRMVFAEEGFKVMLHECWSLDAECTLKRWRWLPDFLQRLIQGKSRSYLIIAKKLVVPLTPGVNDWFTTSRPTSRSIPAAGRTSDAHSNSVV